MNENKLKEAMNVLLALCNQEEKDYKKIIASAVALGMKYQEEKIRKGIDIVFDTLHNKDNG